MEERDFFQSHYWLIDLDLLFVLVVCDAGSMVRDT
jgi:hypothetical protein